jgi:hypothetical protein
MSKLWFTVMIFPLTSIRSALILPVLDSGSPQAATSAIADNSVVVTIFIEIPLQMIWGLNGRK